jgi:hypothetical protein
MRRQSSAVIARQSAKADARSEGLAERIARLTALCPNADPASVKYVAIHCATIPTFPHIIALLSAR